MQKDFIVLTYERVSTEDQTYTKSCDDQKLTNDRFIVSKGWKIAENGDFRDEGRSGTILDRTGLQDLLLRCKEDSSIKAVVVSEMDRLARGNFAFIPIREALKKYGVEIIAVTQPMVNDTPEGRMIGEILGAVNGLFVDLTRRKSMRALDEKAMRGWWPSKAPLGYKNVNIGTEERPERIIEVNEEEAIYIRQIPSLYNQGHSYQDIADQLYMMGLRGHQQGKVSANEIRLILFNDFYLGEFTWRGKKQKGKHTPLFNSFEVYKARNRSNELGHIHSTAAHKGDFPFKKLPFFCATCNCRITAEKKRKHYKRTNRDAEYILYHCTKSRGGWKGCLQPTINNDDLIQEFAIKAVTPISIDEELANFLFEEMNNDAAFREQEREKIINNITRRVGQIDTELHNLFEMYISGKMTILGNRTPDQVYEEFRLKREMEREKLLKMQQKLLSESTEWKEKASNFFSLCVDAKNRFLNSPEERQANFLRIITSNVLLDNKQIVVTHQFPFSILTKQGGRNEMLPDVHSLRTHFIETEENFEPIFI